MKRAGMFVLLTLLCAAATAQAGERRRLKEYLSPDSGIVARILTVSGERGRNAESNVEFRRRSDRKLIGAKSFMSNDHQHGLGVLKAGWSPDANFFVFSMVSSGGQYPGVFPTFAFNRKATQIVLVDAALGANIASPEFELQAPDRLTVTVQDSASGRARERTVRLAELRRL